MKLLLTFLVGPAVAAYPVVGLRIRRRLPRATDRLARRRGARCSRAEIAGVLLVMLAALALRVNSLTRGLTFDELCTAVHFVEVGSLWKVISTNVVFNNHLGYSVLAYACTHLVGRSELALRLPALVLGLGGVGYLWWFARGLLPPAWAVLAALVMALSPEHVRWSVSARGYSGLVLFSLVAAHYYFRLLAGGRRGDWLIYIAASVVGTYFHLYAALLVGVQMLFLVVLASRQVVSGSRTGYVNAAAFGRLWPAFALITVLSLACYAPVLRQFLFCVGTRGRVFQPNFPFVVVEALAGVQRAAVWVTASALCVYGLAVLGKRHPPFATYVAGALLVPLLALWLVGPRDLFPRFFAYFLPYYCLAITVALRALGRSTPNGPKPLVGPQVRRALFAASALVLAGAWGFRGWHGVRDDWGYRDACQVMEDRSTEATSFCAIGAAPELFRYYCRGVVAVRSLQDFRRLLDRSSDLRCVYLEQEWQRPEQGEIARFVARRATSCRVKGMTVFFLKAQ